MLDQRLRRWLKIVPALAECTMMESCPVNTFIGSAVSRSPHISQLVGKPNAQLRARTD